MTESEREKDPAAVALGRKGGLKGGPARAAKLSAERRSAIARKAATDRWFNDLGEMPDRSSGTTSAVESPHKMSQCLTASPTERPDGD